MRKVVLTAWVLASFASATYGSASAIGTLSKPLVSISGGPCVAQVDDGDLTKDGAAKDNAAKDNAAKDGDLQKDGLQKDGLQKDGLAKDGDLGTGNL
jgi:hypothetical protein